MDLIETNNFFIIVNGSQALYCDRLVGKLTIRHASDVFNEWNPVCLGKIDGVIGKIRYHSDSDWRLFLISASKSVGILPDGLEVRRISRVTVLVLNTTPLGDLNLNSCTRSHPEIPKKTTKPTIQNIPQRPFMKLMQKHVIPPDTKNPRWRILKRKEKYEQRIEEELINMLQSEDESYFYFSPGGGDLTNWTQRKTHPSYWNGVPVNTDDLLTDNTTSEEQSYYSSKQFKPVWHQPVWRRADERFFWNFYLISQPIIEADRMLTTCGFPAYGSNFKSSESLTQFNSLVTDLEGLLMPIVQGYVHFEELILDRLQGHLQVNVIKKTKEFTEKPNSDLPLIGVEFLNNSVNTNSNEDQINIIGLNDKSTIDARGGRTAHHLQPFTYINDNVGISVKQDVEFDSLVFSSIPLFSSSSTTPTPGTERKQSPSIIKLSQSNSLIDISNGKINKLVDITTLTNGGNSITENTVETVCLNTRNMASSNNNLLSKNNPYDSNNINKNSSHNHLKPMIIRDMEHVTVIIFSRRSCYRAGTRYRRRGIDMNGHVANYVETEQILHTDIGQFPHTVVFLQCRGSVPLYWSQTSLVYNPPILLEKSQTENQEAFNKYWSRHFQEFERILIVNLLSSGRKHRETILTDAFLRHILLSKNEQLAYIGFDFHDFCRNSQFQNASVLLSGIDDLFRNFKYCWVTHNGVICEQRWLFHVNCLDCLDRTNLVQCMFAVVMITNQLKKIGLLGPEECLPAEFLRAVQHMWATNGDAISRIYAGTSAMKGDYTRTGSRTVNGLMRDGVYSVSRYYLRLREITRQAAIDLFIGNEQSPELIMLCNGSGLESSSLQVREERIKLLISRCQELLIQSDEKYFAECLLVSYSEFIRGMAYVNTVVLITDKYIHFIRTDFINRNNRPAYIRIPLLSIERLELGLEPAIFRPKNFVLRIFYKVPDENSIQKSTSMDMNQQTPFQSSDLNSSSLLKQIESSNIANSSHIDRMSRADVLFGRIAHVSTTSFIGNENKINTGQLKSILPTGRSNSEGRCSEHERDVSSGGCAATVARDNNSSGIRNFKQAIKIPKTTYHFLEFLQPDTRLFNKVLVPVPPGDETLQALRVVASTIIISLHSAGNNLELIETKPPIKLQRLRQANLPKAYQPPVDLQTLGSGLRAMGRRRESQTSLRGRHRMSRTSSIHNSVQDTHGITVVNTNDKNQISFSKLNGNLIKQRLKQIKLPKLPFNFGRNMRSTYEQGGNEVPIVPENVNNTKQIRDESISETIDCRGLCSPKFKLKHNKNDIYNKDDDHEDEDDDEIDEETEDTDNSDCIDDETDIELTDDDPASEDNQSKNRLSMFYQESKFPKFRRSIHHNINESFTRKQIMASQLFKSSTASGAHYKQYSQSEPDLCKKIPVLLTLSSTSSSFNDLSGSHFRQEQQSKMLYKPRKKLMRESYRAMNKSKISLELNRFPNAEDSESESIIVANVVPQVFMHEMNLTTNEKQLNLESVTLEQLLYGIRFKGGSIGNINDTCTEQYDNSDNDQIISFDYLTNNIVYERLKHLFKDYTQTNIMKCILYSEYINSNNNNTISPSMISSSNITTPSMDQSVIYKDNDLYELLQHVYLPEIDLFKSPKLTIKLERKQIYSLIQLNHIRRELFMFNNNDDDENEKSQWKQLRMIYSSFILF
ncbi:unnamed protein product [Schistosoma haematobium]|nr:unnamed protein product [Schistosoma haematobium]